MMPTQVLEARFPMKPSIESPIRHAFRSKSSQMDFESLSRPLRSYSRKHHSLQLDHRYALLNMTPISGNATQSRSRPRLRRIPAFSDLAESLSSAFDPVVSVFVAEEEWLEQTIAKTKKLIGDKEGAEQISHRVRGVPSFECLYVSEHSPPLRRKRKSGDLRTEYGSDNSDGPGSPLTQSSPCSSKGTGPCSSLQDCTTIDTSGSDTSFNRAYMDFVCTCGRACNFPPGELILCAACGEWASAGGGEQGTKDAKVSDSTRLSYSSHDEAQSCNGLE